MILVRAGTVVDIAGITHPAVVPTTPVEGAVSGAVTTAVNVLTWAAETHSQVCFLSMV